jgi:DNA-binding transcriptional ArsR family regulator
VADDDRVFKALADPTRRFLLDRLFARDGRTLTDLESELAMTRFGVMKHLRVLEDAGLVTTRRSGREKLHFLNPVPIRLIHDRWIDKYRERHAAALADLKSALEKPNGESEDERGDAGLPGVDQGDARGDLAGDHEPGVDEEVRLRGARGVRAEGRRKVPGVRQRGDEEVRRARRGRRR